MDDGSKTESTAPQSPSNAGTKRKRDSTRSGSESDLDGEVKGEEEEEEDGSAPQSPNGDKEPAESTDPEVKSKAEEGEEEEEEGTADANEDKDGIADEHNQTGNGQPNPPRELHRTASIFLRNLAPTITKLEVEAVSLSSIQIQFI